MNESFLHYIWQFQYFHKEELQTSEGDSLQIFQPGNQNVNAGPDFSDARIKIGLLEWRGSVEIHIKASGWNDHHHSSDQAYEKVVLHVVWDNDKPIYRTDGTVMPTLELKHRVEMTLWNRYKKLFTSVETIPCSSAWPKVPDIIKLSMLDKAVMQRLEVKSILVKTFLVKNRNDWEETCFQLLCKNFGFKVNAEPMLHLAQLLPYKVLLKHLDKLIQIEALLLGQAGFLEKAKEDEYTKILKREHRLLSTKYGLEPKEMKTVQWRFLRLRPANFPTVRLAQLAVLLLSQRNLFSKILECSSYKQLVELLDVEQSEYWQYHYQLGKKSKARVPALGQSSIHNIMINTIVPLLVAYGQLQDDQSYVERATEILQNLPAENNKITRQWLDLGYKVKSSFDSQGLIELYNNFCMKRRCLDCTIGTHIIKATI
jgi:hypothetical protein